MSTLLTIVHVIVCLFLMLTVLLQSGKGGGMGAAFGGGNAATVFGGSGASNFLRRLTAGAATIFMLTSVILAFIASHNAADPLDNFGNDEAERAKKLDEAAKNAIDSSKKGSGAGSATVKAGSATAPAPTPTTGSATTPTTGSAATGSATAPIPAPAQMSPSPLTPPPAKTGSASAPAPAPPAPAPPPAPAATPLRNGSATHTVK